MQAIAEKRESCDLLVVDAPPGGIAMAVTAARAGLSVILTSHTPILGGMMANGLGVWDTLFEGRRSPVYDELRQAILDHYRRTYGEDSQEYREALPAPTGHSNGKYEASVACRVVTEMVAREPNIRVFTNVFATAAQVTGATVHSVTLEPMKGVAREALKVSARAFADCSYEGDLAALCGVRYRLGRESRDEFDEPDAGVYFAERVQGEHYPMGPRMERIRKSLNLRWIPHFWMRMAEASTGKGDKAVQAYNYRTVFSTDPSNRRIPPKPHDYDRQWMKRLEWGSLVGPVPHDKFGWNRPQVLGAHSEYAERDWEGRQEILDLHWKATLQMLYYLQNDPSVDRRVQERFRTYGLAKDEFPDNGNRPYEIYAREARRIVGRDLFTEHDALPAATIDRAPLKADAIAVTEWYMDAHACTDQYVEGSIQEGKCTIMETVPGQLSYGCLLPENLDNLLVPICASSTHIGWGTIRLEPTWMNIGETAALAVIQALDNGLAPSQVDIVSVQREAAERRIMLTFFNDVDVGGTEAWIAAVQFFGTKGFFPTYNAYPTAPLDEETARIWMGAAEALASGGVDPMKLAVKVPDRAPEGKGMMVFELRDALARVASESLRQAGRDSIEQLGLNDTQVVSRGEGCRVLFEALAKAG